MKICLEDYGSQMISCIKVIRKHTDLGLKEAKELVSSTPININSDDYDGFLNSKGEVIAFVKELKSIGASASRIYSSVLTKDIKKVMRKAFEHDEFEILNKLIEVYEMTKVN